jgi:hypothetical protein
LQYQFQMELRLASFFLAVICCPFQLTRISVVDENALSAPCRAEIKYRAVVPNVHHSRGWWKRFSAEGALVRSRQDMALPDLLRFTFSLSKYENISDPDRSFDVSCYDSALVSSFKQPDSNLDYFASHAGPTYDLRNLRRCRFLSGSLAC